MENVDNVMIIIAVACMVAIILDVFFGGVDFGYAVIIAIIALLTGLFISNKRAKS